MRPLDYGRRVCNVCGQERESQFISEQENKRRLKGTRSQVIETVLYCNDKAECTAAAPKFSLQPTKGQAMRRRTRAVGQ